MDGGYVEQEVEACSLVVAKELERRRMAEALVAAGGVKTKAAQLIDMPIRTFTLKLKQYKL